MPLAGYVAATCLRIAGPSAALPDCETSKSSSPSVSVVPILAPLPVHDGSAGAQRTQSTPSVAMLLVTASRDRTGVASWKPDW